MYDAVMSGNSDSNIDFKDFQNLILALGFSLRRQNGSHLIYVHKDGFRVNIQKKGNKAKKYQVKQLRDTIRKYGL